MTPRAWFRKEISIRLTDENSGFVSTTRYGKIGLKPEAFRMKATIEGVAVAENTRPEGYRVTHVVPPYPAS